jgi:uncharacterized lipoprotein YbaY
MQRLFPLTLGLLVVVFGTPTVTAQFGFPSGDSGYREREGNEADQRSGGFGWGGSGSFGEERIRPPSNNGNWRLGVTVDNTATGVRVRKVERGSAADSAGIEVGDVIITVGGYQVGYVGGRLFDVGEEFRRRVDSQGRVELLVRDVRRNELRVLNVGLKSASVRISGEIRLSDNRNLPPNAILQLQLVSRNRPNSDILGGSSTQLIGNQRPIRFDMNVDTSYLRPGEQYELRAAISSGRETLYLLRPGAAVDPLNNPDSFLRLTMQPAGGNIPDQDFGPGIPPNSQAKIVRFYESFLDRTPQQWEVSAWVKHFNKGLSADDLPRSLLVSDEFYDKSGGNSAAFVNRMFLVVTGKQPTLAERNRWQQRFQQLGGRDRTTIVREFWREYGEGRF